MLLHKLSFLCARGTAILYHTDTIYKNSISVGSSMQQVEQERDYNMHAWHTEFHIDCDNYKQFAKVAW